MYTLGFGGFCNLLRGRQSDWRVAGEETFQELARNWLEPHIIRKRQASLADAADVFAQRIPPGQQVVDVP